MRDGVYTRGHGHLYGVLTGVLAVLTAGVRGFGPGKPVAMF